MDRNTRSKQSIETVFSLFYNQTVQRIQTDRCNRQPYLFQIILNILFLLIAFELSTYNTIILDSTSRIFSIWHTQIRLVSQIVVRGINFLVVEMKNTIMEKARDFLFLAMKWISTILKPYMRRDLKAWYNFTLQRKTKRLVGVWKLNIFQKVKSFRKIELHNIETQT